MNQTNRHHLSTNGDTLSASRFARCTEMLPHSIQTAVSFLSPHQKPKTKGAMMDGRFRVYWVSSHKSPQGVKYRRLLRLRRRLFINREQGGRVNA